MTDPFVIRLLVALASGPATLQDLARALESPTEVVEGMLAELARVGLVERPAAGPSSCAGCPLAGSCQHVGSGGLTYHLTDKGLRTLERRLGARGQ